MGLKLIIKLYKWISLSRRRTVIFLSAVAALLAVLAFMRFTQTEFAFKTDTYHFSEKDKMSRTYKTSEAESGPAIRVQTEGNNRKVIIQAQEYAITRSKNATGTTEYAVDYPNGHHYRVEDQSGTLRAYDQDGNMVSDSFVTFNNASGSGIGIKHGDELYPPEALVTAAYAKYHHNLGHPFILIMAILLFVYGWCGFRYEQMQRFQFLLSFKWIWTNDTEPSDFYFFMCKVGGVLTMASAAILVILSLTI